MNNKIKMLGIALVAVLAVAALGAGIVFAQTPAATAGFGGMMGRGGQSGGGMMGGRGGMMNGNAQNGETQANMAAMHQWMNASDGMHTAVWNALAEKLGLTSAELTTEVNSGKTIAQIADAKGISRADMAAVLESAHKASLTQAVTDGVLTQAQADSMLSQMTGRYDWMLDNMSSAQGQGMMNGQRGAGGMMNGQRGTGSCGAYGTNNTTTQPKP